MASSRYTDFAGTIKCGGGGYARGHRAEEKGAHAILRTRLDSCPSFWQVWPRSLLFAQWPLLPWYTASAAEKRRTPGLTFERGLNVLTHLGLLTLIDETVTCDEI